MRRTTLVLALAVALSGTACAPFWHGGRDRPRPPRGAPVAHVGAAERSVLPTVDGTLDYLADADLPGPRDATSPGIFVPEWDQGRVAVGNGDARSHWVHDDLKVKAVAIQERRDRRITVVVASNLYMIFRRDAQEIRERARARLPRHLRDRVDIAISADHNHHGPDTAFDVNHEWYELFIDRAAETIADAVHARRPAHLRVAETRHHFGLGDGRDPQVIDPTLGVLQAVRPSGHVIATLVLWSNHPEVTLGYTPPVDLTDECAALGIDPASGDCHARNRYFTADFPGVAADRIERQTGGLALFFNGAIGTLVTPLRAAVWEVTRSHPLGDGITPPSGAAAAGGGTDYDNRNFRRTQVIGEQLALAALGALRRGEWLRHAAVSYETDTFYTRLSNFGFRVLGVVDPATGHARLGHLPAELHTCPAQGPKTEATCVPDGFATAEDPLLALVGEDPTYRVGDHVQTEVGYLRIGPVGMMFLPAEVAPELVVGLPAEYRTDPGRWHADDPAQHAYGDEYTTPGYVKNRMDDRHRWVVGLGNDQLGYVVPRSDYRVLCILDELAPGTCAGLHASGAIDHPDSVAGEICKLSVEDPAALVELRGDAAESIAAICRYGQAFGEADGHYEETNSAGWDLADDLLAAVARLTGDDDAASVNPDFPGYWRENPPSP